MSEKRCQELNKKIEKQESIIEKMRKKLAEEEQKLKKKQAEYTVKKRKQETQEKIITGALFDNLVDFDLKHIIANHQEEFNQFLKESRVKEVLIKELYRFKIEIEIKEKRTPEKDDHR